MLAQTCVAEPYIYCDKAQQAGEYQRGMSEQVTKGKTKGSPRKKHSLLRIW